MSPLAGVAGLTLGLVGGSFVGALVTRWPERRSVARGRSRCDGCRRTLGVAELVPVLSYLRLRGRCRACGGAIARDHLWAELGGGLVGLTGALVAATLADALLSGLFGGLLLALALLDVRHLWLPDRLTYPLLVSGLLASLVRADPMLVEALITAAAAFTILELLRRGFRRWRGREGLGGGDPKLAAALGAWMGALALSYTVLAASLLGLLWAGIARMGRATPLPLGTLLALAAWPVWLANLR